MNDRTFVLLYVLLALDPCCWFTMCHFILAASQRVVWRKFKQHTMFSCTWLASHLVDLTKSGFVILYSEKETALVASVKWSALRVRPGSHDRIFKLLADFENLRDSTRDDKKIK
ncbi:hypothetical protein XENORESO_001179 [Xenotaenia resolanae]|uniref:Uncharacterized protein n=1 Tax=Xenotaenia resolanae TaxID=208358 RepID=A0ABV0VL83_9TELE